MPTIGVEFGSRMIALGEKKVKLQIWDTAGEARYKAITLAFYKGTMAVIICFKITDRDQFSLIETFLNQAKEYVEGA